MHRIPALGQHVEAGGRWPPTKKISFILDYFGFFRFYLCRVSTLGKAIAECQKIALGRDPFAD